MKKIWLKSYPTNIPHEIGSLSENSIADMMRTASLKYSNKTAFTNLNSKLTYSEVDYYSDRFGYYLQNKLSINKGSKVAIMLPNLLTYPVVLLGSYKAGATVVNINPLYKSREIQDALDDSGARTIIVLDRFLNELEPILKNTKVKNVIVCSITDLLSLGMSLLVNIVTLIKNSNIKLNKNYIPFSMTIKTKYKLKIIPLK